MIAGRRLSHVGLAPEDAKKKLAEQTPLDEFIIFRWATSAGASDGGSEIKRHQEYSPARVGFIIYFSSLLLPAFRCPRWLLTCHSPNPSQRVAVVLPLRTPLSGSCPETYPGRRLFDFSSSIFIFHFCFLSFFFTPPPPPPITFNQVCMLNYPIDTRPDPLEPSTKQSESSSLF